MSRKRLSVAIAVLGLLCACGGGGGGGGVPQTPRSTPTPAVGGNDDWITYAHDYARSGQQVQNTGITSSNIQNLKLKWSTPLNEAVFSSPVVYGGYVIVATHTTGTVYALDTKTGKIVWTQNLGGQVRMTPTIADGLVIVGTHLFTSDASGNVFPAASALYALNLTTGTVNWKTNLPGTVRSDPAVMNGTIYEGVSGGDPPTCLQGGMFAFDELSGAIKWRWIVDPTPQDGGSAWSPVSTDGAHVVFGTGNTCGATPSTVANGIVALNADGSIAWNLQSANAVTDDDTGGGVLMHGGIAYALNKNGTLYATNAGNGELVWKKYLGAPDGAGGIATATTDGTYIFIPTHTPSSSAQARRTESKTFFSRPETAVPSGAPQGALYALDMNGNVKWSVQSQARQSGYVALADGMAFVDLDDRILALNPQNGSTLWSYRASGLINASPVVVPSGIYTVDSNGVVYKFGL
jgi:outer membrane protein assembly factor BamB